MIDIKINDDGCPDWAFIKRSELMAGKTVVYLGGNMEELNSEVVRDFGQHVFPVHLSDKLSKSNMPATVFFQEGIEDLLSHEFCHIIIYKLTESYSATQGLDTLDYACKDVYDILAV